MKLLLCVLGCLVLAACAPTERSNDQDQDRHGGFYGGVTGGMTHP